MQVITKEFFSVRSVSQIIKMKINELGGIKNSDLARKLNWGKSKNNPGAIIGQYINEKITPSLDFAIRWKEVFNENMIDLMFEDDKPVVNEAGEKDLLKNDLIDCQRKLIKCSEERAQLKDELETLKKFGNATGAEQLKKEKVKH